MAPKRDDASSSPTMERLVSRTTEHISEGPESGPVAGALEGLLRGRPRDDASEVGTACRHEVKLAVGVDIGGHLLAVSLDDASLARL